MLLILRPYALRLVLTGGLTLVFLPPSADGAQGGWEEASPAVTAPADACRETAVRTYMDAGDDGQWGTVADVLYGVTFYEYGETGRLAQEYTVTDPGPDGLWGTEYDVVGERTLYAYDDAGRHVRSVSFKGAGDHEPVHYGEIRYDRFGRKQLAVEYGFPAGVTDWSAHHDERLWYSRYLYDSHGRERSIIFGNRDEMTNEFIHTQIVFHYDAAGNRVHMLNYQGAVTDPSLLPSLTVIGWTEYEFDEAGRQDRAIEYVEPGFDGEWQTADDIIGTIIESAYHDDGRPKGVTSYNDRGPDEVWGTGQDIVQYRTLTVWSCDIEELPEFAGPVTSPD